MTDSVELSVDGVKYDTWLSYRIDANLYKAADAFNLELVTPETDIKPGMRCVVRVNGHVELTGIIDAVRKMGDKSGDRILVEGRDLSGLLVDSYCEKFVPIENMTIKQLAEMLVMNVPFVNRCQIDYQDNENVKGKFKGKKQTASSPKVAYIDTPQKISQIEPGMTVFEVLATYAASRGLLFYSLADGTMVFGRPKTLNNGPALFHIVRRPGTTNFTSYEESNDFSRRYSQIVVVTQQQATPPPLTSSPDVLQKYAMSVQNQTHTNHESKPLIDTSFPYHKPMVAKMHGDSQTPELHARMLYEKQLHDSYRLEYTVPGHSQEGENWRINELVKVTDDKLKIDGVFLIFARTFQRSKSEGSTTRIMLGQPGLVAAP